jgi:hypothetical protein
MLYISYKKKHSFNKSKPLNDIYIGQTYMLNNLYNDVTVNIYMSIIKNLKKALSENLKLVYLIIKRLIL